jgi:general stress protein YciG
MATDQNNDESMTASEAGKMGGEKVRNERGAEFYSEIGSQQGKDNNPGNFANRPTEEVQAAGEKGGRSSGGSNETALDDELDEAA